MIWCSIEEETFRFCEGIETDPRFNSRDWRILKDKIEAALEHRLPKPIHKIK